MTSCFKRCGSCAKLNGSPIWTPAAIGDDRLECQLLLDVQFICPFSVGLSIDVLLRFGSIGETVSSVSCVSVYGIDVIGADSGGLCPPELMPIRLFSRVFVAAIPSSGELGRSL